MKQCRFCLDDEEPPENPLIEPCPCTGSIRYVHRLCLERWAGLGPENARLCSICKNPYTIDLTPIPPRLPLTFYLLNNTAFVGIGVHYLSLNTPYVISAHLCFQLVWAACFARIFQTRRLDIYLDRQIIGFLPAMATFYCIFLYRLIIQRDTAACFLIDFLLHLFWNEHIHTLRIIGQ